MRVLAAAAVVAAAAATSACELAFTQFSAEQKDVWERSYALDPKGEVEIRNTNGTIEVEASADGKVSVSAERVAKAGSDAAAKELLGKIEIREEVSDAAVRLETKAPSGGFMAGHVNVNYRVRVPPTATVRAVNTNGRVTVVGISGRVVAETTNGGVEGRALAGPVTASTTNGGVEVSLSAVHGDGVSLETVNGGVELAVPADAKGDLSLSTVNGGIDTGSLNVELVGEKSRRRLEGRLNGGGPRVRVETVNGGVRVKAS
jgi:DUF4097 and DUF4098 domain-containing protein YvlB